jgi:5-formyltetrahydrofolate cyclo-ligase
MLLKQQRLLLPRASDDHVEVYLVSSLSDLVPSKYAILEPDPSRAQQASFLEIDVILVSGLCFDANNARLGHGSGYYDKLIYEAKKQNPSLSAWGIGYLEQLYSKDLHHKTGQIWPWIRFFILISTV